MLKISISLLLLAVIACAANEHKFKKHFIDMNPDAHPDLTKKGIQISAQINQWMEITCPQYDQATPKEEMRLFYLYEFKTNKKDFEKCAFKDKLIILSCDSPYKTTKLTLKFQKRSPYPLGFTFKEEKTYYYLAIPKDETNCTNAVSLKVDITKEDVVVPSLKPVGESTRSTTTTSTTTTTMKTTTRTTTSTTPKNSLITRIVNSDPQVGAAGNRGGNDASNNGSSLLLTCLLALLALWRNV